MTKKQAFGILGTGICYGQKKPGVDKAFDHLESLGFWQTLKDQGVDIENHGGSHASALEPGKAYSELFYKTLEIINTGEKPILIGGDHSQALSTIGALLNKYPRNQGFVG